MKAALFALVALVLLSAESVLARTLGLTLARVDICMALVVYLGLRATVVEGAVGAFAVGYLVDVFTGRPTGLQPFLAVLIYLAVRAGSVVLDGRSRPAYAATVAAATLANALLAAFFTWLTSRGGGQFLSLSALPLQMVWSALVAALLWPLLRRIEPGEHPEPGGLRL